MLRDLHILFDRMSTHLSTLNSQTLQYPLYIILTVLVLSTYYLICSYDRVCTAAQPFNNPYHAYHVSSHIAMMRYDCPMHTTSS